MKAVVLVGGEGTRLRPLTETIPKPLLPLMDRPSLDHVLDHLARHDVHEVVLSSSYLEETFRAFMVSRRGDPAITWITETEPLGTGGAVVNALEALDTAEPFLALNGDILTDLDLTTMLQIHRERGASVTIALTHVEDARPFGLVLTEPDGRVLEFREKPEDLVPGDINAGTYVLDPESLHAWAGAGAVSIEREIFPALIAEGRMVHGYVSDAYWLDIGSPETYLQAHVDLLDGRVEGEPAYANPYLAPDARVDPSARLAGHVVVGPRSVVGAASVSDSVLMDTVAIEDGATVERSVLGPKTLVRPGANVTDSVLGEGAAIEAGVALAGGRVSAGETVSSE